MMANRCSGSPTRSHSSRARRKTGPTSGAAYPREAMYAVPSGFSNCNSQASRPGDSSNVPSNVSPFVKWPMRLAVGGPSPGARPRLQPVADAFLGRPRLGEMVSEQLRLGFDGLREPRFEHLGDPLVGLLPLALDQRAVQRVFKEGVFE